MRYVRPALSCLVVLWSAAPAAGQPLGTFRWQIQPYCNVLTLNVAQQGGVYTLDGSDDRCGAAQAASARGIAFLNPSGTIGFGVTMVQPGGVAVHLEAAISLPALNGTWRDSSGASGSFMLTPGAGIGGPARGVAASGLPPGSITSIQLANGAVGTAAVAANTITTDHVLDGSLTRADIADAPRVSSFETSAVIAVPNDAHTVVAQVTVSAPAAGKVVVNSSGTFIFSSVATTDYIQCSLTTGFTAGSTSSAAGITAAWQEAIGFNGIAAPFGGSRVFSVNAGSSTTFRLVCYALGPSIAVQAPTLNATFVAGS